jgi:hypothetical protein
MLQIWKIISYLPFGQTNSKQKIIHIATVAPVPLVEIGYLRCLMIGNKTMYNNEKNDKLFHNKTKGKIQGNRCPGTPLSPKIGGQFHDLCLKLLSDFEDYFIVFENFALNFRIGS